MTALEADPHQEPSRTDKKKRKMLPLLQDSEHMDKNRDPHREPRGALHTVL